MQRGSEPASGLVLARRQLRDTPRSFRLEAGPDWWSRVREGLREPVLELLEPFALSLDGHALGRRLLFRGSLAGRVELGCSRCAEAYELSICEPVELLLEPASDPEGQRASIELDPEEASLGRYVGEELDFEPVLDESLWLAWPMQPLCREDCLGLCAGCGRNRNLETCGCDTGGRRSPFAGLADKLAARAAPGAGPEDEAAAGASAAGGAALARAERARKRMGRQPGHEEAEEDPEQGPGEGQEG